MNILTVNLLFSTLVFGIAARIYVLPRLRDWGRERVLTAILVLHSFRHLGLMFLAPGAVGNCRRMNAAPLSPVLRRSATSSRRCSPWGRSRR